MLGNVVGLCRVNAKTLHPTPYTLHPKLCFISSALSPSMSELIILIHKHTGIVNISCPKHKIVVDQIVSSTRTGRHSNENCPKHRVGLDHKQESHESHRPDLFCISTQNWRTGLPATTTCCPHLGTKRLPASTCAVCVGVLELEAAWFRV
jgi:hypothetical protein